MRLVGPDVSNYDLLLVGKDMKSFAGVFTFSYIGRNLETRESPQHS